MAHWFIAQKYFYMLKPTIEALKKLLDEYQGTHDKSLKWKPSGDEGTYQALHLRYTLSGRNSKYDTNSLVDLPPRKRFFSLNKSQEYDQHESRVAINELSKVIELIEKLYNGPFFLTDVEFQNLHKLSEKLELTKPPGEHDETNYPINYFAVINTQKLLKHISRVNTKNTLSVENNHQQNLEDYLNFYSTDILSVLDSAIQEVGNRANIFKQHVTIELYGTLAKENAALGEILTKLKNDTFKEADYSALSVERINNFASDRDDHISLIFQAFSQTQSYQNFTAFWEQLAQKTNNKENIKTSEHNKIEKSKAVVGTTAGFRLFQENLRLLKKSPSKNGTPVTQEKKDSNRFVS